MDMSCRTCKYFSNSSCDHPEMCEELDIWNNYLENIFDMGYIHEAVSESCPDVPEVEREKIIGLVGRYLSNNLPVREMKFTPPDYREFCCNYYE